MSDDQKPDPKPGRLAFDDPVTLARAAAIWRAALARRDATLREAS